MRDWYPLIELLVREAPPRAVWWFTSADSEAWRPRMAGLCREVGAELSCGESTDDLESAGPADLVLLEGDLDWFSTISRLRWLAHWVERSGDADPVTLVSHVGWPYGRRDWYRDPASLPPETVHPHRRGGLLPSEPEPVPGRGFAPDREHALLAHPFHNGRLTAVEDFLSTVAPALRLRTLPGFHGLGILAPEERLERSPSLRRVFDDPGDLLLDLAQIDALEAARLEHAMTAEPDRSAGPADPAPPGPSASVVPPPELGPREQRPPSGTVPPGAPARDAEGLLAAEQSEVRRLASALLEVRGEVLDLLQSSRWKVGDRLGDLSLRLRRRTRTQTAADRLTRIFAEIDGWRLSHKVRRGRTDPVAATRSTGPGWPPAATLPEPESSLFHRVVARLEPGEIDVQSEEVWRRTRVWVDRHRGQPPRQRHLVSVIMPTRDRGHVIGEAITSILDQSYQDWELIVCADGEAPDTREVIEGFEDPRIRSLTIAPAGAAAARNRALEVASGELIAYLDDDNLWHPDFLATLVGALDEQPAFHGGFSGYLDVEVQGERSFLRRLETRPFDFEALCRANFIDLNMLVHRRELYDLFGGFDESLTRHQDWDLVLRYGFVGDLLAVDALLGIYRRNRQWGQISTNRPGTRSWNRVRTNLERAFAEGGPARVGPAHREPLALLFEGRCEAAWNRAEGLWRALGARSGFRLVALGQNGERRSSAPLPDAQLLVLDGRERADAMELAECCREGFLYVLGAADPVLDLARSARALADATLLVEREPAEAAGDATRGFTAGNLASGGVAIGVVHALSPGAVPTGFRMAPSVSLELVPEGDGDDSSAAPAPSLPILGLGGAGDAEELSAIGRELLAVGLDLARCELSAPGWERGRELRRLLTGARALLVIAGRSAGTLSAVARQAVVEAFAIRVPVIAVPHDELRELADAGCLTLAGGEPREIAARALAFLEEPELPRLQAARAWRHARRRYAPGAAANALELILAGARRSARGPEATAVAPAPGGASATGPGAPT